MKTCVIMRCHNEMPYTARALKALSEQDTPHELIIFDNASTDGTVEEAKKYTDRIFNVPAGSYVPGKVLNQAMQNSEGEITVFLNADCIPQNNQWLKTLIAGFQDEKTAAVFGRQIAHPDHNPLYIKDTENTFGDGENQKNWRHCFSMASSAIRRSVWQKYPFNEKVQYSEDIEWTWRMRQLGYEIVYVPGSIVMHSHNYTLKQYHKRHFGEGKAEAVFFEWSSWDSSFLRYSLMPYLRQVASDMKYCLRHGHAGAFFYSPALRMGQLLGRRKGLLEGLKLKA